MQRFSETLRRDASALLSKCLDGIETFQTQLNNVCNESPATFVPLSLARAPAEIYITEVFKLLYAIYSAKFAELIGGVVDSTARQTYLVFAYCGRGFIETTATLRFYNKKTNQLFLSAKNPDVYDTDELREIVKLLDKHARGGRFDWTQYWTLGRKNMVDHIAATKHEKASDKAPMSNPSQINAKSTIDTWASDEPGIALIYDFFCEIVHPNIGSNFLVMGADDETLYAAGSREKTIGRSLAAEGIQLLAPVVREAAACMAQLLLWKAMCEKAASARDP